MTRVLIVDDNAQNLYLLRALLQGHGLSVDEAHHGAEALVKARQSPPDLVVADLLMPVMDGYALLRHWKADARLNPVPFVVYTATYVDPKDERLALSLGADAFIVKPAEPEAFMARIGAVLARIDGGERPAAVDMPTGERGLLDDYNEVLVRKLEAKARQLERINQQLTATVAECRRTESALQESEERFRVTFEQAAVGIAHVGVDGKFLRVNDKLCELTGYRRGELLQMNFADVTVSADLAEGEEARRAMLSGAQRVYSCEKRYRRKAGGTFWGSLVVTLLRSRTRDLKYFIAVITDVTERKALQEQFQQAQKIESIGQLTGGIAHDFNNLLTVVIGNADLMLERLAGEDPLRPLAEMTRTAASRGAELTQRLLAFARRQALDPRAVDLHALLHGMESMLRRMLPENIEIDFIADGPPCCALVDASQLESALMNLCINARDAMPRGGRLVIEAAPVPVDGGDPSAQAEMGAVPSVRLRVSDTGTGIAPEHLARVFEPFFTTKPAGKGTGLGLSMVYGFAKQSRGHVAIDSEPGRGTTVALYLPAASGVDESVAAEATPQQPALRGTECILLVEDEELVRLYAEQQLLSLGYRVLVAADGAAALALLEKRPDIDLLFSDVIMPGGMNGRQLADAALALRPGLKVLFCSGYGDDAIVHQGRLDRGVQLLGKPYGRTELGTKIRAALAEPGSSPAVAAERRAAGRLLVLDDDPMIGRILCMTAETLGFQAAWTPSPHEFFGRIASWQPSHVAIDLSMPEMGGLQVLGRLAQLSCAARVIISSGADRGQIHAALEHARALGLGVAGGLSKPFNTQKLRAVLTGDDPLAVAAIPGAFRQ